ncbi:sensor histidine kinase [Vibrio parahaemolyticus]|uniref:sensor histidine kinase n=1 Tax=Vibrio parahaemolyticus TaxID=670 RepID=UPI0028781FE4|nr:sensor histidine kinase [Vibrio parahaemolyticus]EIY7833498.1 sensor histidine kinase [Vibrio parahaemolyticus]EJG1616902.1 sensor histidine kinase [Vibrio parahaemolyticus]ELZ1717348.1 sensor histidine kinase [Vibrio parahaemolyticus]MDS1794392.1 sensor histidine kinase [Vibrio parahaemolyticus]MDS1942774.1 sensor histidine kinase [Vibrio parahaemolyticus]
MSWRTISFRKRMLVIMTLSGLIELLLLVAAGFTYLKVNQEHEMGEKALGVARFLAESEIVIEMVEAQQPEPYQESFRALTKAIGAAFIVIGDNQGVRLIHPVDERIGKPMKGGDNQRALVEGQSYVSTARGSLGYSVRGKAAIFDAQGNIIGVVSVGYLLDRLQDRIEPFLAFLILMVVVVVVANAVVSNYASRKFQRAILGFEPEEIGRLYGELEVTMSTIKEGVLSIDAQGVLRSINRSACQILGIDRDKALNKPLTDTLRDSDLYTVLETGQEDHDIEIFLNHKRLIANRSPIFVEGKIVGAVSSFRLRDEINELTEQLSQTKEYADLLRSQTHEHRNKLNTISGLVQMGELEAVQKLIGQETAHYQAMIEFLRDTIKDPLIAGMLLGKTERARELGLQLVVEEGSRLEPLSEWLNSEDLVTILGNLIDNAFDATLSVIRNESNVASERRNIEVSVSDYGNEVILEVSDHGCGLPENIEPQTLLKKGISTKSRQNRGVGLHLVNQLATRYHGHVEMLPNTEHGTRITVYLPKEEQV